MKKVICILTALVLVFTLFAACGDNSAPAGSTPSSGTNAPNPTASTEPGIASAEPTVEPVEDTDYSFAAGKVPLDAAGYPTEGYAYDEPFCTTDETLTFMTTCFYPASIPESGYTSMEFPMQIREQTGVNVEYVITTYNTYSESLAVLVASDDLCDITMHGSKYYTGGTEQDAVEDGYFVNLLDYKEYCPNYLYEIVNKDPSDLATRAGCFYSDDLLTCFKTLSSEIMVQLASSCRGDWLDDLGLKWEDIVTVDDLYNLLYTFKTQIDGCEHPWGLLNVIEMAGSYTLNCFDTIANLPTSGMSPAYQVDGQIRFSNTTANDLELVTFINKCYEAGFISPDWQGIANNAGYDEARYNDDVGYAAMTNITFDKSNCGSYIDPDAYWVPIKKLVKYEGQVLHVGDRLSRVGYGSSAISAKCENIPLAVTWCDWRYSEAGSFMMSYGVQGTTWDYNADGDIEWTEFVTNNPNGVSMLNTLIVYTINQLGDCGLEDATRKFHYPGGMMCVELTRVWRDFEHDDAWDLALGFNLNTEETDAVNHYSGDINTYMSETYMAFVDGSKPLGDWDSYISTLNSVGLTEVTQIYQEAYDRYVNG